MKIIFLDIDGVLNHELYYKENNQPADTNKIYRDKCAFDPEKIKLLNYLIKETDAKVVVSSSWRQGRTIDQLIDLFINAGFEGKIIDKTPKLFFNGLDGGQYQSVPRGNEIHVWLQENKGILGNGIGKYNTYVIFDDDTDMLYWQRNNYIQVDSYCGLTPNIIQKAKLILNQ